MTEQNQITDADLQALLTQNPLAAEQLRRIIAERQRDEALERLASQNGQTEEPVPEKPTPVDMSG